MGLWRTCCFVAVKGDKDTSHTCPVILLPAPTRHLCVGLRAHPSSLVRRSTLSPSTMESRTNGNIQRSSNGLSPVHNPLIKLVQECAMTERTVLARFLRVDRVLT